MLYALSKSCSECVYLTNEAAMVSNHKCKQQKNKFKFSLFLTYLQRKSHYLDLNLDHQILSQMTYQCAIETRLGVLNICMTSLILFGKVIFVKVF